MKLRGARMFSVRASLTAVLAVASLFGGALPSAASLADPIPAQGALRDRDAACPGDGMGDLVPGSMDSDVAPGDELALDVLFLLDGVTKKRAKGILAETQLAYDPLRIRLVPTFERFPIEAQATAKDGQPAAGFVYLLGEIRRSYPASPVGIDVVHLLTGKDLLFEDAQADPDGTDELAGIAACVGGVRYDGLEFSISEAHFRYSDVGTSDEDPHAVFLAHEIGHLLGAHHHYGNCAEGKAMVTDTEDFCTVMNSVYPIFNSLKFGVAEARVIRGYVEAYAAP